MMNRNSLGTDIFSPVRLDTSFVDHLARYPQQGVSKDGFEKTKNSAKHIEGEVDKTEYHFRSEKIDKRTRASRNKDRGSSKNVFLQNSDKLSSSNLTDDVPAVSFNDSMFAIAQVKDASQHSELLEKQAVITKKKKSSTHRSGRIDTEKQAKDRSSQSSSDKTSLAKKHNKNINPPKFVTVRNDRHKSNAETKTICKSSVNMSTHSEKLEELKVDVPLSSSGILSSDKIIAESNALVNNCKLIDLESSSKSLPIEEESSSVNICNSRPNADYFPQSHSILAESNSLLNNGGLLEMNGTSSSDCSAQSSGTNLIGSLHKSDLKEEEEVSKEMQATLLGMSSEFTKNIMKEACGPSTENLTNQPSQIQANIIEKLISDTVSFEFDAIRQQLYLQHMSTCKLLNRRMEEFEKQNTGINANLYKIIEELLQENRQLRNAVIAHQYVS